MFTRAIVHVVAPLVMRLKAGPLTEVDHLAKGTSADKQLLAQAAGANLALVTHEGLTEHGVADVGLRARAIAAGVSVFTAEEYLRAEGADVDQECYEFIVACRAAMVEAAFGSSYVSQTVILPIVRFLATTPQWSRWPVWESTAPRSFMAQLILAAPTTKLRVCGRPGDTRKPYPRYRYGYRFAR